LKYWNIENKQEGRMSNETPAVNEVNTYLLLRKAKIARNNEKLEKLGLNKPNSKKNGASVSSRSREGIQDAKWRPVIATRRSSRLSSGAVEPEVPTISTNNAIESKSTSKKRQRNEKDNTRSKSAPDDSKPKVIVQSEAKPGTTRATYVDVKKVLHGHFDYPLFIGRRLANTGKAAVVEHAAFMCGNEAGISFNKYSGVCEFQNDALFLWVNMNTPDADIKNDFVVDNDKAQMTWYGGSRMREESPVIQKLISIGKSAANGNLSESCGIVLWYRLYNIEQRKFEPYSCLGRLTYHSHESGSQPLKFTWNLLDYDRLKQTSGSCIFDEIMERNM